MLSERVRHWFPGASAPPAASLTAVFLLLVVVIAVFRGDAQDVAARWWHDPTYSHGLLLAPLTLALIVLAVAGVRRDKSGPDAFALLGLCGVAAVMLVGALLGIATIFQLLLPILLLSGFLVTFGRRSMGQLWFPVLFLYFSLPIWGAVNPLLQDLTTSAVSRIIFLAGIPAFINGNFVTVSAGVFEIAEGCSGLRFVIISGAVASLYAYLYLATWKGRAAYFLFGLALAIIGNWVRVFIVIVMGTRIGIDHPYVANHAWLGWLIFAFTMLILFGFAGRFAHSTDGERNMSNADVRRSPRALAVTAPSLAIVVLFVAFRSAEALLASQSPQQLAALDWIDPAAPRDVCGSWRTRFVNADAERRGVAEVDTQAVCVDVVFYASQRQDSELVNTANRLYADKLGARTVWRGRFSQPLLGALVVRRNGPPPLLIAYRYIVGGVPAISARDAKLLQGRGLLAGRTDGVLVAYAATCDTDCQENLENGQLPEAFQRLLDQREGAGFTVAAQN